MDWLWFWNLLRSQFYDGANHRSFGRSAFRSAALAQWQLASLPRAVVFYTIFAASADRITPRLPAILFGTFLAALGPLFYVCTLRQKRAADHTTS